MASRVLSLEGLGEEYSRLRTASAEGRRADEVSVLRVEGGEQGALYIAKRIMDFTSRLWITYGDSGEGFLAIPRRTWGLGRPPPCKLPAQTHAKCRSEQMTPSALLVVKLQARVG